MRDPRVGAWEDTAGVGGCRDGLAIGWLGRPFCPRWERKLYIIKQNCFREEPAGSHGQWGRAWPGCRVSGARPPVVTAGRGSCFGGGLGVIEIIYCHTLLILYPPFFIPDRLHSLDSGALFISMKGLCNACRRQAHPSTASPPLHCDSPPTSHGLTEL